MILSLLVHSSPFGRQASRSAYHFAEAAIAEGHALYRVFFIGDGALHGNGLSVAQRTEIDLPHCWQQLSARHGVDLVLCVNSALRHGVLDAREAKHRQLPGSLRDGFTVSGLGQLVDAALHSDRVVSFGG